MKTIFRYTNMALLLGAAIGLGTVAGYAQTAGCDDKAAQDALYDNFLKSFPNKTLEGREGWLAIAKEYKTKYGTCTTVAAIPGTATDDVKKSIAEGNATNIAYFDKNIPNWEKTIREMKSGTTPADKERVAKKFNDGIKAKNWDEVYAAGKEAVAKWPDEYRPALLVLGTVGYDESVKTPANTKYNEDTLRYAKQAISDLEAGKTFGTYNLGGTFVFKDKDDALGWMYTSLGYLTYQRDKKEGVNYLYKATQLNSTAAKTPMLYALIGDTYADEARKLAGEADALGKQQSDSDTPEIAKQRIETIKGKVALAYGYAERALDAYTRAHNASTVPTYKESMMKTIAAVYDFRFGKSEGLKAWMDSTAAKSFLAPTVPVTPVADPALNVTTVTTTSTIPAAPAATPVSNPGTTVKPVPATAKPAAPAAKPQAVTKKSAKKKAA